jgi:hypothetical protein
MGFEINWHVNAGAEVLQNPLYIKWSQKTYGELPPLLPLIKADINAARASNQSSDIVNYLLGLLRVVALVA